MKLFFTLITPYGIVIELDTIPEVEEYLKHFASEYDIDLARECKLIRGFTFPLPQLEI